MLVNSANLDGLRVGFKTNFQGGLGQASTMHSRVSTAIPSSLKKQSYGWLGKIPNVREWVGPALCKTLNSTTIRSPKSRGELTISVDRDDIETDNLGIYGPLFTEMGQSTGSHWGHAGVSSAVCWLFHQLL